MTVYVPKLAHELDHFFRRNLPDYVSRFLLDELYDSGVGGGIIGKF
jgi:hypothetical protein